MSAIQSIENTIKNNQNYAEIQTKENEHQGMNTSNKIKINTEKENQEMTDLVENDDLLLNSI
jgi:hypothetical protein